METRRKGRLLPPRKRVTNGEVVEELKYLLERSQQVQAEVSKSIAAMVELLAAGRGHRSALNAGVGIIEEYISSVVQCGEDADELFEKQQQEALIKASTKKRVRDDDVPKS
jgi:hypothetical protein